MLSIKSTKSLSTQSSLQSSTQQKKKSNKKKNKKPETDKLKQFMTSYRSSLSGSSNGSSDDDTNDKQNNSNEKSTKLSCYNSSNIKKRTSDNGNNKQQVIEYYMECLDFHKKDLGKDKLTIWMQVGSFFEVYGIIYPDGTKQGNVWDVAEDLDIKVAKKDMSAYNNPALKCYMAGVKEEYAEPYLETLVDKHGWTVAIYTQEKPTTGTKHHRVLKNIISPGINFESDNISNTFMYVYFKGQQSRITGQTTLHIAIFYVDCISGKNGIQEIHSKNINECNVELSEVVKMITIKNPVEIIIHMDIPEYEMYKLLSREECYNTFGLYNRNVSFIIEECPTEFYNKEQQKNMLEQVYKSYIGRNDIFQSLGIDGQFIYGRVVLVLALNNIFHHDTNILSYLEKPEVLKSSSHYLILANNCLQQLDIINGNHNDKISHISKSSAIDISETNQINLYNGNVRRKSLLDILDKTKSVIGRREFRNRISLPITDKEELENRYNAITALQTLQKKYITADTRNVNVLLGPYNIIRGNLGDIKDISKIIRKIVTRKCMPSDISVIYDSIVSMRECHKYITKVSERYLEEYECSKLPSLDKEYMKAAQSLIKDIDNTFNFEYCITHWSTFNNSIFKKGYSSNIDELQRQVESDRDFFMLFRKAFSILIDPTLEKKFENTTNDVEMKKLLLINEGNNAKFNNYLYCNEKAMKALKQLQNDDPSRIVKVGENNIKLSSLEIVFLRKGVYHIKTEYVYLSSKNYATNLEELKNLCQKMFSEWCLHFYQEQSNNITEFIKWIGNIDVLQSCAIVADKYGYTRPEIKCDSDIQNDDNGYISVEYDEGKYNNSYINVEGLRHPIIERYLDDNKYVPNDISLSVDNDGILLFGLNAAGKSSLAKSIGCAIIMAQAGMFVACSSMTFNPYKYLFTRIRNNDDIYAGLSSFEVEMREFKVILDYSNSESLILGDELCSGTETLDATALMASGLQQLCKRNASFIFATHLHFLTELECVNNLDNLVYKHIAVNRDPENSSRLIYERKLRDGNGPQSYGILVCKSMNLDYEFVKEAERIRTDIERGNILKFNNRLTGDQELVKPDLTIQKHSKYNKSKLFKNCEVCGSNGEHIHHIDMQCSADEKGIIIKDKLKYHKNEKWNLVCLCINCHQEVHKPEPRLVIHGYLETTDGRMLNYELTDALNSAISDTDIDSYSNVEYDSNSEQSIISVGDLDVIPLTKEELEARVIHFYVTYGNSYRKVQNKFRTQYDIKITLKEIDAIVERNLDC
jgi:DNA mismatch repair protein MutS